jgi:hypothetical protein
LRRIKGGTAGPMGSAQYPRSQSAYVRKAQNLGIFNKAEKLRKSFKKGGLFISICREEGPKFILTVRANFT